MPQLVYDIIDLIASLIRFLGLIVFGLGFGWLAIDLLKKSEAWQVKIAVFLGLAGLVIALAVYTAWGALGGVTAGIGLAILLWGMPKKPKEDKA
jgi:NhaP-type Na+/H+ or K+/H+ antiporter